MGVTQDRGLWHRAVEAGLQRARDEWKELRGQLVRLSEASQLSPRLHASASAPNISLPHHAANLSIAASTDTHVSSNGSDSSRRHGTTSSTTISSSQSMPSLAAAATSAGSSSKRSASGKTKGTRAAATVDDHLHKEGTKQEPQRGSGSKGGIEVHSILHGSGIMLPTRYHHWEQIFVYPIRKVAGAGVNAAMLLLPKQHAKRQNLRRADGSLPSNSPTMIHVNLGQRMVQYWCREELCCEKPLVGAQVQKDTRDPLKFRVYYPDDPEPLEHWIRDAYSRQDILDLLTIACAPDFKRCVRLTRVCDEPNMVWRVIPRIPRVWILWMLFT